MTTTIIVRIDADIVDAASKSRPPEFLDDVRRLGQRQGPQWEFSMLGWQQIKTKWGRLSAPPPEPEWI